MQEIDVLFTADSNYLNFLLASIYSFLLNSNIPNVHLHIITSGFTQEDYAYLDGVVSAFDIASISFYPLETFDIAKYQIPSWHGTQIANSRLFFQDIITPYTQSVLYLDSDTITVSSLQELASYQNGIYAAPDICSRYYYKSLGLSAYYNSGVILFDINKWLNGDFQKEIIDTLNSQTLSLAYPDQDLFNYALNGQIDPLPASYNLPPHAYIFNVFFEKLYFNGQKRNISDEEIRNAKNDAKILHSYGLLGIKPWQSQINPFSDLYMKYIYAICPDFISPELTGTKKWLARYPFIFKTLLFSRTYLNEKVDESIRKITLNLHK